MHLAVVGIGATGTHAARTLRTLYPDVPLTLIDKDHRRAHAVAQQLGAGVVAAESLGTATPPSVVVLCVPAGLHPTLAELGLRLGADVVSIGDAIGDVEAMFALDGAARQARRAVIVGAGYSPGLSCVLARHAADLFESVQEISVAKSGTGGPDCARQHHRALKAQNWEWRDGRWIRRRGSTGRRLAWFPDPIGALDCYRAGLAEPFLLQRSFPVAARVSARMAATRRDRLTGWLPMLRPPHADGGPGGLRVEVWGRRNDVAEVVVYGAAGNPAQIAGTMAAVSVEALQQAILPTAGANGLSACHNVVALLRMLARHGVRVATFEGAA